MTKEQDIEAMGTLVPARRAKRRAPGRCCNCVLSDFDRTIVDLYRPDDSPKGKAALVEVYKLFGIDTGDPSSYKDAYELYFNAYEIARNTKPLEVVSKAQRLACESLKKIEEEASIYASPIPGAIEALRELKHQGIKVAVVSTNSVAVVTKVLKATGASNYVDAIVARRTGDFPYNLKPNPGPLFEALALVGCSTTEAILVGDSISDIVAAKAGNVLAVGVLTGQCSGKELLDAGAYKIITSIAELPPLLASFRHNERVTVVISSKSQGARDQSWSDGGGRQLS